jgi:hypothetical protein
MEISTNPGHNRHFAGRVGLFTRAGTSDLGAGDRSHIRMHLGGVSRVVFLHGWLTDVYR